MRFKALALFLVFAIGLIAGPFASAQEEKKADAKPAAKHSAAWYKTHGKKKHSAAWYKKHSKKKHSAAWYKTHGKKRHSAAWYKTHKKENKSAE